ncbi:very-long-chain 3-oxoacyl-CoA reductase-B-like [Aphomia sociella]
MAYMLFENIGIIASVTFLLFIAYCIWRVLYVFIVGPMVNRVNFKTYGKWALITGSTDGIGKEYARQLAAYGCNIVLVSRSTDRLRVTAQEIEKEFKVQTKIVQIDFTESEEIYTKLSREIKDLEIGVLVNNVGVCYEYPEYFLELPDQLVSNLVKVNVVATMRVLSDACYGEETDGYHHKYRVWLLHSYITYAYSVCSY